MQNRIRSLRKTLGLTQHEFAQRMGSVQNTIAGYETGRRVPSNQVIALICREFDVNEEWLRSGQGGMFVAHSEDERVAEYIGSVLKEEEGTFQRRFLAMLADLTPEDWNVLERMVDKLSKPDNDEQTKNRG